ncbi:MAG: globin family protein [Pseudomonadota bacterium]
MLTARQAELIQTSFAQVAALGDAAGELFYQRLFDNAPTLRRMFPTDIKPQARKLTAALATVADHVSVLDTILPVIDDLGRRHATYGVQAAHYDVVGKVLLATLQEALGDAFTPETEDAWAIAYRTLAKQMIAACQTEAA